jgi:hypothetical protein
MARFSERIGVKAPKTVLQLNSMDLDLRNGLWNVCYDYRLKDFRQTRFNPSTDHLVGRLWRHFFKLRVDEIPYDGKHTLGFLRAFFLDEADWSEVYDFVEFLAQSMPDSRDFAGSCNRILERELSGYRFSGGQLVPITDEQELTAVEKALALTDPLTPVRLHVQAAVGLFADRKAPDYRNSIKESISAVEAMCNIITGDSKATLGQALKRLEDKGIPLHEALKKSFSNLYGYTSDADGIRHALLDESSLDFDDAKFMLVACSAFVNYLAAKAGKAGVIAAR